MSAPSTPKRHDESLEDETTPSTIKRRAGRPVVEHVIPHFYISDLVRRSNIFDVMMYRRDSEGKLTIRKFKVGDRIMVTKKKSFYVRENDDDTMADFYSVMKKID